MFVILTGIIALTFAKSKCCSFYEDWNSINLRFHVILCYLIKKMRVTKTNYVHGFFYYLTLNTSCRALDWIILIPQI